MRLPNGYGGVRKLSGNRRKPYQAVVTINWILEDGKAKQKQKAIGYFKTRQEALNALADYNLNPIDIDKAKTTFADMWDKWLPTQEHKSESKLKGLRTVFNKSDRLHNKEMCNITLADLQNVIDAEERSHSYKSNFIVAFRSLFEYAENNGYIKNNVAPKLKNTSPHKKPTVNIFTYDEFMEMPAKYKLFFYTGVRVGEMINLTADDVDFERDIIHIRGTKTKNADRFIPIHPEIKDLLQREGKIWPWNDYYNSLLIDLQRLSPNHSLHDLRKTFATVCYMSDVDDVIIKRLMGHQVRDLTHSTYIKNDDIKLLREGIEKMDYSVLKQVQ